MGTPIDNEMSIRDVITREELKGAYSEGEALAIYRRVKARNAFAEFAAAFMHDEDYQVARNAIWGLTKATDEELQQLQPMLHTFIDLALSTDNSSVRRLALNTVERLRMEEEDLRTDFYNFCIEHMTDVTEYPGIQSLCMKLAYRISQFYPELQDALIRILEGMEIDYYKPAVKSVQGRILGGNFRDRQQVDKSTRQRV